jgi:hypothetical protein
VVTELLFLRNARFSEKSKQFFARDLTAEEKSGKSEQLVGVHARRDRVSAIRFHGGGAAKTGKKNDHGQDRKKKSSHNIPC